MKQLSKQSLLLWYFLYTYEKNVLLDSIIFFPFKQYSYSIIESVLRFLILRILK